MSQQDWGDVADFLIPKGQTMNFKQAVEKITREFITDKKSFSAHDISVELRKRVNQITIDDRQKEDIDIGGYTVNTIRVDHEEVKPLVHDFMTESMDLLSYRKVNPNGYWLYEPDEGDDQDDNQDDGQIVNTANDGTNYDGTPQFRN